MIEQSEETVPSFDGILQNKLEVSMNTRTIPSAKSHGVNDCGSVSIHDNTLEPNSSPLTGPMATDELLSEGREWMSRKELAVRLGVPVYLITKRDQKLSKKHPDWFEYRMSNTGRAGSKTCYLSPDAVTAISKDFADKPQYEPQKIWKSQSGSEQDDVALACRNVQVAFLNRFPEFNDIFPRDNNGKVLAAQAELARTFILDKIGSQHSFRAMIGTTPLNRAAVPSFEGRLGVALQKTFADWGIDIPVGGENLLSANVLAQMFSLDIVTVQKRLKHEEKILGRGQNGHTTPLYSLENAKAKLEAFSKLPRIDPDTGIYIDSAGQTWKSLAQLSNQYGLAPDTVRKLASDIPTLHCRSTNGTEIEAYPELLVAGVLAELVSLPVASEVGEYTDDSVVTWETENFLAAKYDLDGSSIRLRLTDVPAINGRILRGRKCKLYEHEHAKVVLDRFIALPKVDMDTGKYIDSQGETWVMGRMVADLVGQKSNLRELLGEITQIKGRGRNGAEIILYNENQIRERFIDEVNLPRADSAGFYIDTAGNVWVAKAFFTSEYGIGGTTIDKYFKHVRVIRGRGANGVPTDLYHLECALIQVNELLQRPMADLQTDKYIDENGQEWVNLKYISNILGLSVKTNSSALKGISAINARDKVNKSGKLYNLSQLESALNSHKSIDTDYYERLPPLEADDMLKTLFEA